MKVSKEIKTALLVIASVALLFWGYNFLNGSNVFSSHRTYYVTYDNVEGLAVSAPVTVGGFKIGKVNNISLIEGQKIKVELQIDSPMDIFRGSKAAIYSSGVLGGKQIALELNTESKELLPSGEILEPKVQAGFIDGLGDTAAPLMQKFDSLLLNVNKLVAALNNTLDASTQQSIKQTISGLSQTLEHTSQLTLKLDALIAGNQLKISSMVDDFNATSKNLNKISSDLSETDFKALVSKFDNSAASLQNLLAELQSGEGTMGKFLKDEAVYKNLEKASREMALLIEDLKLNPKRYVSFSVFGKKAAPYKNPSDTIK